MQAVQKMNEENNNIAKEWSSNWISVQKIYNEKMEAKDKKI